MSLRKISTAIALCTALALPGPAGAQEAQSPPSATATAAPAQASAPAPQSGGPVTAKSLYDEGVDLTAAKDFKGAEAKFLQAWNLQKTYDIAANLGEVEMLLDRPAEAAFYLKYALNNYPASGKTDKREWIENRLGEAKARSASVTVSVNVPGADVRINGKPAGKTPIDGEVFVPPGDCTIEVSAPDYQPGGKKVQAAAGSAQKVQIDLVPSRSSGVPLPALVAGGVGLAAIAAGAALTIVSGNDYDKARALSLGIKGKGTCGGEGEHPDCAALKSTAARSDVLYGPGLGLLIGGAVIAAASGVYIAYSLRPGAAPRTGASPRITTVGLRGTGLLVQGSF
jgi:hypothetical protein